MKPHFEAASKESAYPFVTVDVDIANSDILNKYQIMHVPTVLEISKDSVRVIGSRTAVSILNEVG